MNRSKTGSAGNYARTKTPNSTGACRYREEFGPASVAGFRAFLAAAVASGQMTDADQRRRIMVGK